MISNAYQKQLDTLKRILEEEKQAIKRQMNLNSKYSNRNTSMRETVDELSAYDNHPADLGTELFEREREFALEEHQDKELEKVNFALSAIRKGIYGKCQVCGEEIPFERLEVLPSTLHCVNHSQETSDRNYRPVREELLEPPMVYSFRHNLVDTQDSYEEVAKFGTSETPPTLLGIIIAIMICISREKSKNYMLRIMNHILLQTSRVSKNTFCRPES